MNRVNRKWNPDIHIDTLGTKIEIGDRLVYTSIKQGHSLLFAIVVGYTKSRLRIVREATGVETTITPRHSMVITEQIDLYDPKAPAHNGSAREWFRSIGIDI